MKIYVGSWETHRGAAEASEMRLADDDEVPVLEQELGQRDSALVGERVAGIVAYRKVCRR